MTDRHPRTGGHGEHSGHRGYRYGVFLRPDAATSLAVTTITTAVRQQYGLVSAGAFPPHATLAGHVVIARPDTATADRALIDHVSAALTAGDTTALGVRNPGTLVRVGPTIAYGLYSDGQSGLVDLAGTVNAALDDIRNPDDPHPHRYSPETFRAHLSLASHDLYARPDLTDEVAAFIEELPVTPTPYFTARTVNAYRFHSPDWSAGWWHAMTWEHLHTWYLPDGFETAPAVAAGVGQA
ncbi:hypothetical protein [Streptomyces sp. NPDC057199]|uniref:hypothetical protein n=1 Tax=Streptomyces sp. NPDC057199 TaxID=3346047 RepID=UPI003637B033